MLKETRANTSQAMADFETIREQIDNRNELLILLNEELTYLDSIVVQQELTVDFTQAQLDSLESEYGQMMREAVRHKLQDSRLQFILTGSSLTAYYNRWRFLKAYQTNRKRQLELILEQKSILEKELEALKNLFREKEELVMAEQYQNELLAVDLELQSNTLKALKSNETELRTALKKQEMDKRQLNRNIQEAIAAGMAKAKKEKSASNAPSRNSNATTIGASSFAKAKGQLSWPVQKGIIIKRFGTQPHPTIRGINISNNGIDIRSQPGAAVKVVFNGEVLQSQQVSGSANILVIGHGNYYTVYSNLASILVNEGDQVKIGQIIGTLNTNANGQADLHFEIWKEKQKLNPAKWISR